MIDVKDEDLILACNIADTMAEAARLCELPFSTFKRRATTLGVYKTNQGSKGLPKAANTKAIPLQEILEGLHPTYQTYKLKLRLYKEGLKHKICECCGLQDEWQSRPIEHHLDHKNGIKTDHRWHNLQILCPNCHSQTDTYTGKNKGINSGKEIQRIYERRYNRP